MRDFPIQSICSLFTSPGTVSKQKGFLAPPLGGGLGTRAVITENRGNNIV